VARYALPSRGLSPLKVLPAFPGAPRDPAQFSCNIGEWMPDSFNTEFNVVNYPQDVCNCGDKELFEGCNL